jgi:hypothetical protein
MNVREHRGQRPRFLAPGGAGRPGRRRDDCRPDRSAGVCPGERHLLASSSCKDGSLRLVRCGVGFSGGCRRKFMEPPPPRALRRKYGYPPLSPQFPDVRCGIRVRSQYAVQHAGQKISSKRGRIRPACPRSGTASGARRDHREPVTLQFLDRPCTLFPRARRPRSPSSPDR